MPYNGRLLLPYLYIAYMLRSADFVRRLVMEQPLGLHSEEEASLVAVEDILESICVEDGVSKASDKS